MKHQSSRFAGGRDLCFCPLAYTLVELMIVIAILGTLAGIAAPIYFRMLGKARLTVAIVDLRNISASIDKYKNDTGELPGGLDDLDIKINQDPWGNSYKYVDFRFIPKGKRRKDRNLVPVNSTYDLFSMGADGESKAPFTAKASRDDIVRANDGAYLGLASDY